MVTGAYKMAREVRGGIARSHEVNGVGRLGSKDLQEQSHGGMVSCNRHERGHQGSEHLTILLIILTTPPDLSQPLLWSKAS